MDLRIKSNHGFFFVNIAGISDFSIFLASTFQELFPRDSTLIPRERKTSNITPVSSISGMLFKITGSLVRTQAAIQGSAAFLFPLAFIVPLIGNPPST